MTFPISTAATSDVSGMRHATAAGEPAQLRDIEKNCKRGPKELVEQFFGLCPGTALPGQMQSPPGKPIPADALGWSDSSSGPAARGCWVIDSASLLSSQIFPMLRRRM